MWASLGGPQKRNQNLPSMQKSLLGPSEEKEKMTEQRDVNKDFKDFLELLDKHKVDYCIIGGYAVAFHAQPRYTKDLDIFVAISESNAQKMVAVIKEFAGDDPNLNENIFKEKGKILRIGMAPNRIEIINDIDAVNSVEVIANKVEGHYGGVKTFFIGLDELIKNKEAMMKKESRKDTNDANDYAVLKKVRDKKRSRGYTL